MVPRSIPGFRGYYATEQGEILKGDKPLKARWQNSYKNGATQVVLRKNGKYHYRQVARLVYSAFHGKLKHNEYVRHLDGNGRNNALDNLYLAKGVGAFTVNPYQKIYILELHSQGSSIREIAKLTKISKNTVHGIIRESRQ